MKLKMHLLVFIFAITDCSESDENPQTYFKNKCQETNKINPFMKDNNFMGRVHNSYMCACTAEKFIEVLSGAQIRELADYNLAVMKAATGASEEKLPARVQPPTWFEEKLSALGKLERACSEASSAR